MQPSRIAIVEDQALYRHMLEALLSAAQGFQVLASAASFIEGQALLKPGSLDAAVVDVSLGDGSGIELGLALRSANPRLGIVALSAIDAMDELLTLPREQRRGWGYLSKLSALSPDSLLGTIRATMLGRTVLDSELLRARQIRRNSKLLRLGRRQQEVLALVAEGLSNSAIAERLAISPRTIESHLRAVYSLLELDVDEQYNLRVEATLLYLGETGRITSAAVERAHRPPTTSPREAR